MAGGDRVPDGIEPMLATPDRGRLPDEKKYAYEWKWDGYRAVMRIAPAGTTVLTSRNRTDFTPRYPELTGAFGDALGGRAAVLDGEIVALDESGRPDFGLLQNHGTSGRTVAYFAFDVLQLGTEKLLGETYDERRKVLAGLEPPDPRLIVITPSYSHDALAADGTGPQDLLDVAAERGLEGLVAKDRRSKYHPGRRSPDWLKHPLIRTQEVIVGGWRPGQGNREGTIGALLLGAHDPDSGDLLYIGDVGTGFTRDTLADLQSKLNPLERKTSPFANEVPRDRARDARWVTPKLVGEVVYRQFTPGERRLRHTAWRGWRPDKAPADVEVPPSQ